MRLGLFLDLVGQGAGLFEPSATLALDFTTGRYRVGAGGYSSPDFASLPNLTVTRATPSVAYGTTSAGVLVPFAANVARITDQGLLVEESRVNSIRNSTPTNGSAAGTPGTSPTNWTISGNGNGLSVQIVGTGTDAKTNMPYIDVRFFGTTTGTQGNTITFEGQTQVAASNAQVWTNSAYLALVGGSTANIANTTLSLDMNTAGGAYISQIDGPNIKSSLTATTQRFSNAATLNQATTGFVKPYVLLNTAGSGVAIDITIRVVAPQLELGAFATSYIPTTTASVTRAADSVSISNSWAFPLSAVAKFMPPTSGSTFGHAMNIDSGSSADQSAIYYDRGLAQVWAFASAGSVTQAAINLGAQTAGATAKAAARWGTNDFAGSLGGGAVATDTTGTVFTPTTLWLGRSRAGGAEILNGYVQSVVVYPRAFSNAELIAAST